MISRQDIAELQCHPRLGQSGNAGAHDPHPPPCSGPGEILPWCAQQLGNGFLIEPIGPVPLLIQAPMADGRQTLTFNNVELVVVYLSPL